MVKVIIDCDPGIDDALALILAINSKQMEIEAVTTVGGNVPVETSTTNALKILELTERTDVPVAKGLNPKKAVEKSSGMHGEDGLGDTGLPEPRVKPSSLNAKETILSTTGKGDTHIVSLGPLTNIASAIQEEPSLTRRIRSLTVMGGAITAPGNITPSAEFNIYMDPEAARTVFHSGMKITLVPLDVTMKALLKEEHLKLMEPPTTRTAEFVSKALRHYLGMYRRNAGIDGCPLHDPLAVAHLLDPTLMRKERLYVDVETKGEITVGETVADLRGGERRTKKTNMEVCLELDSGRFIEKFLEAINPTHLER
ncbi:MAG: nucleoside hydrolase [Candidatus Bathyarchaeia archaeon]